ncbi:hypothetical protein IAI18_00790 [Acetobacteraceae bacterium H6797]|nr:hypothetical protein [Acetobacteraceae bacterium H6797]
MIWDKPWIYGPMMHLLHWQVSLWPVVVGQGLMLSWLLWRVQAWLRGEASAGWHLGLCVGLALLTPLPFTAALLMPDVLTPVVVLGMALLAWAPLARWEKAAIGVLVALAIASHLSHLPLAAGLVAVVALAAWRKGFVLAGVRAALPLLGAIGLLLVTNAVGHGRWSLSPHGATFMLARLIADGPAARTIEAECPARGWYLCGFVGKLPTDSDIFLWDPASPMNRDLEGRPIFLGGARISPEAREIVAETIRREPGTVAMTFLRNTIRQLGLIRPGDTLIGSILPEGLRPRIAEGFPARELAAYDAGLQSRHLLEPEMRGFGLVDEVVMVLAIPLLGFALWRRREAMAWRFAALVLMGLLANAAATGGLSGPHDRYQARIAWLLPAAAVLLLMPQKRETRREII